MNHFKNILLYSFICSLAFFTNCTWDNFFWVAEKAMPDELNIETISCHCGEVIEINIPRGLTDDQDTSNCRYIWQGRDGIFIDLLEGDPSYYIVKNNCSENLLRFCSKGIMPDYYLDFQRCIGKQW